MKPRDERRPLERGRHVPERQAVPDAAELEAHHPDEVSGAGPARVHARAQHRPLLAPEEGEPHAEPARRIGDEPGAKGAQDAHGRRVVVGPRTARNGIVVGREHERPGSGPEIHEEVDPRALDGPIRIAADRQAGRAQHGLGQLGPLPVGPPGEEGRQVARRGRGQPAIAGEVEQGRRGPAPAAVHQPRGRDVQGAAHGAAQPQPPAARAFRGHAGEAGGPGPSGGRASSRAAFSLVVAATVPTGTPRSSATRAAVTGRYAGSLR